MAYSLATSYAGEALLSNFNWFNGADPNHGFVAYQSRENAQSMGLYSIDEHTGVVRLGVDSSNTYTPDQGRPSIRLESKQSFNQGLFIADFLHMPPSKCGLWPAFWAYGSDWPNNGEIDIVEGVNLNTKNIMSAHTRPGCSQTLPSLSRSLARFTGQLRGAECSAKGANVGCGVDAPAGDDSTYGDAFNDVGGGVYAMQWDEQSIKLWHFARGRIPDDVEGRRPEPEGWGLPQAVFGGEECDTRSFWKDMNLVLNINFCGDYAGSAWGSSECSHLAPTCEDFVARNPGSFKDAYWDVRYIDVYQRDQEGGSPAPPHPPLAPQTSCLSSEKTPASTASASTLAASPSSSAPSAIVETMIMTVIPQPQTLLREFATGKATDAATINTSAMTTIAVQTSDTAAAAAAAAADSTAPPSIPTRRPTFDGMLKQPPCPNIPSNSSAGTQITVPAEQARCTGSTFMTKTKTTLMRAGLNATSATGKMVLSTAPSAGFVSPSRASSAMGMIMPTQPLSGFVITTSLAPVGQDSAKGQETQAASTRRDGTETMVPHRRPSDVASSASGFVVTRRILGVSLVMCMLLMAW